MCNGLRHHLKLQQLLKIVLAIWLLVFSQLHMTSAQAAGATVKAVLFYPPLCPSCAQVIDEFLVPLSIEHMEQIELYPVDITESPGEDVFREVLSRYGEQSTDWTQPAVLIADQLLLGADAIKSELPQLLSTEPQPAASTQWPDIPSLSALMSGEAVASSGGEDEDSMAMLLGWLVFIGLFTILTYSTKQVIRHGFGHWSMPDKGGIQLSLLAAAGLAIGIYLSYVTLSQHAIMCGPVGDCMRVQNSEHAKLFGIPMAVWGLIYYAMLLVIWGVRKQASTIWAGRMSLLLLLISAFGVVFSIYLTSLELFVIHAVCLWCLASAVLTALILFQIVRIRAD